MPQQSQSAGDFADLSSQLTVLQRPISSPAKAAEGLESACDVLGIALRSPHDSGDAVDDAANNFMRRLVKYLRGMA